VKYLEIGISDELYDIYDLEEVATFFKN